MYTYSDRQSVAASTSARASSAGRVNIDGGAATDFCLDELERTIEELGGDRIAAMIGEPIMGVDALSSLEELPVVGEVRGVGMMLGIELVADKQARTPISMHSAPHDVIRRETGVLVRDCAHTLVLSPPLIMTEAEAGEVVAAVRSVLEGLQPDGSITPR